MIRFLFGRPGSGKTYRIVDEIRDYINADCKPIWLIVPEQQVYSVERDVLSALPASAARSFTITSFSRLCDTVADHFGGRTQHTVTRAMRSLLMWENLREISGILETYRTTTATDSSLCRKMLLATEEIKVNGIRPDHLESAAGKMEQNTPLPAKLRDLALISASFDGLIREVYGEDPADRLLRTAEQIETHGFFENATVYIDSFTSFTAQEYAVLRVILRQAHTVTIAIGCPERVSREPQFASLNDTVRRLTRLCEGSTRPYEDIVLGGTHRTAAPELLTLERSLWNFDLTHEERDRNIPAENCRGSIRIVTAPTVYDEAEAAALHILELHDTGVPYAQMALVVRDTSSWTGILDAALDRLGIPYFLSARTDLNEKPAARLILCALRCVARHWQAEDILSLGKTGLCGVTSRELDYFSEYVETWHLSGQRMTELAWSMNPDGYETELSSRAKRILEAANRVREVIMTPLLVLEQEFRAAGSVIDECRAIYTYLCSLHVREQLAAEAEKHLQLGQARTAGEAVRLWSFLTETLATVSSVMESAEPLTADEMGTALSLVFANTDIGSVPARHDCVTIGSASTLRVDNIRATLILGLCEGEFPQSVRDEGLLTEQDKAVLGDMGLEFDTRAERTMSEELLYIWRAMTKPSETLILSHSTTSIDGRDSRPPSAALMRVRYLFPYLQTTAFSSRMLSEHDEPQRHRVPMTDAVSPPTARRLYGDELWLSQSRLETYARCPYSYYSTHILRLREPVTAKLDNLGAGVFLHHVMEQYLLRTLDNDNRIHPMEPDEVRELADAIITAYIERVCGDIAQNGRLLHLFDRLRQIALVLIDSIQTELSQSNFQVAGLEWDTHGRRPGDPCPMVLTLEDVPVGFAQSFMGANYPEDRIPGMDPMGGLPTDKPIQNLTPDGVQGLPITTPPEKSPIRLLLGGRVDRVDLYRAPDGETVYLRVIDYKSSKHEMTAKSLTEDMNIQLLLYLFTLCSPENRALFADKQGRIPRQVLPASAVYISPDESDRGGAITAARTGMILSEPEVLEAANHEPDLRYLPSVRYGRDGSPSCKGLRSAGEIAELQELLTTTIRDTAAVMYSGCAHRTPSEAACRYCTVRHACAARIE